MKITIEKHSGTGKTQLVLTNNDGVKLATGGASNMHDAAMWLVSSVNRIAQQTEDMLIEMGLLTEAECENADNWYEAQVVKEKTS